MSEARVVRVELGTRAYDIRIDSGLIARAGTHLVPLAKGRPVVVVTDESVARLHLSALEQSLGAAGLKHRAVILPPGEGTKDFAHFARRCEEILAVGIERQTLLVALGGGVVGDITGFAAASLLRGLAYVQIPTSLLAQVDSSVGGKTAINAAAGKNLVGAFHQPSLVLIDPSLLDSLDARQVRAGYAEIVKYALIEDGRLFDWLEENGDSVLTGDPDARIRAITASVRGKARIVEDDEREMGGRRALLNLGHTFGHALEAETGYSESLLHGEAVALGCVLAFAFSAERKLCS